jgi:hypothetical protein
MEEERGRKFSIVGRVSAQVFWRARACEGSKLCEVGGLVGGGMDDEESVKLLPKRSGLKCDSLPPFTSFIFYIAAYGFQTALISCSAYLQYFTNGEYGNGTGYEIIWPMRSCPEVRNEADLIVPRELNRNLSFTHPTYYSSSSNICRRHSVPDGHVNLALYSHHCQLIGTDFHLQQRSSMGLDSRIALTASHTKPYSCIRKV